MVEEERTIVEEFGEKSKDGDELIAHTLQSIANMPRGNLEDILYKIMTKDKEERYIHSSVLGLPTEERRKWDANMLREKIAQDPTFADTLSRKEGMEKVAPRKNWLMRALGY
tara:strand:- start:219 stop:554 length:336 start_codon:yes stop_codon:yes gene_type:complete